MRKSVVLLLFALVFLCTLENSHGIRFGRIGRSIERAVRNVVVKPVKRVVKNVIEKPIKQVLKAVGLKKVKRTYKEFKQEVSHSKVVFTEDSYRVEKVTPCAHGHHDIVQAQQPTEIHFDDGVVIIQDRYCRKCGEHFYSEPKQEL
ncbi:predicted protein [Nematostella vectensis]|uniref:Uncharacterized protein n=1 Tax=Nematostella vectensis TaxID=45351 RepID=A7SBH4_NEMVE|nr:predicted protein [Nematostella vectensis]|eukprot:XP_001631008.1 predicted protein [Nematostella vectensis]